jgi:hypothetical protein
MIRPIVEQIGFRRSLVIAVNDEVLASLPPGVEGITWRQAIDYDVPQWRVEFNKVWPALRKKLKNACRQHHVPAVICNRLALALLLNSQYVKGCEQFLQDCRPAAVMTDHDRHSPWSSLVLVARRMGFPTYTLVHGVVNDKAIGYAPVLADKVLCWGEIDREKLIMAGTEPDKLRPVGCPRLSRSLKADPVASRLKAGLDAGQPVVLLATAPFAPAERLRLADAFCVAMEKTAGMAGVVRLHPSEKLDFYNALAQSHPHIRFMANDAWTLDEAIAAADVVVVHSSGLGSDALIRGRAVVVFDAIDHPLGHGDELVQFGGCPKPRTAAELAATLQSLVFSGEARQRALTGAEHFSQLLSVAYGMESAKRIAQELRGHVCASLRPEDGE